jgi:hypothetical protein
MKFPPSSHDYQAWLTQFQRIRRWYKKVKEYEEKAQDIGFPGEAEDCIYAFFQNCFHLREWIEKSGVISKKELDSFVSSHLELRICRDICNGTKHMVIDQHSVDANFSTYREYDYLSGPISPSQKSGTTTFRILAAGKKYDMFDLADKCMSYWVDLLTLRKLISLGGEE